MIASLSCLQINQHDARMSAELADWPFQRAMAWPNCHGVVWVMDSEAVAVTRVWCLVLTCKALELLPHTLLTSSVNFILLEQLNMWQNPSITSLSQKCDSRSMSDNVCAFQVYIPLPDHHMCRSIGQTSDSSSDTVEALSRCSKLAADTVLLSTRRYGCGN